MILLRLILKSCVLLTLLLSSACSTGDTINLTLKDIHGKAHYLADYRGQWVLVNFWATWCPPCVRELPLLNQVNQQDNKIKVIAINQEKIDLNKLQKFVQESQLSFPVIPREYHPSLLFQQLPVRGLPTTYFLDPQGRVRHKHEGEITQRDIEQIIAAKQ